MMTNNKQNGPIVIGFFSYEDFIDEVTTNNVTTVRLQDYYRSKFTQVGARWVDYYVEASACTGNEIFLCRFYIGGSLEWEKRHIERAAENTQQVLGILRDDLEQRGFKVRPGIFATKEVNVTATAGLWNFERDEQGLPKLVEQRVQ